MASPVCRYERQCLAEFEAEGAPTSYTNEGRPVTGRRLVCGTVAVAAALVMGCCITAQQRSNASSMELVAIHSQGAKQLMIAADDKTSLSTLMCEIDINWVILRIANAVTAIRGSTIKCQDIQKTKDPMRQAVCSEAINGAIHNLLFIVQMSAKAVMDCGLATGDTRKFWPAKCLDNVFGIMGNLDNIAAQASAVNLTCSGLWTGALVRTTQSPQTTTTRKPTTLSTSAPKTTTTHHHLPWATVTTKFSEAQLKVIKDEEWRGVNCWISQNHIPLYFVRGGVTIKKSVKACAPETVAKGQKEQQKCGMEMLSLFGTILAIAKYVSRAIVNCVQLTLKGERFVKEAACASDVVGIAGSLSSTIGALLVSHKDCAPRRLRQVEGEQEMFDQFPDLEHIFAPSDGDGSAEEAELVSFLHEHFSQEELEREGLWNASLVG